MSSHKLALFEQPLFDNSINKETYRTCHPTSKSFENNDEIEFLINQEDALTDFHSGSLFIRGKFIITDQKTDDTCTLTNNFGAYLFDSATYILNGKEIERVRDVGTTSSIRGYAATCKEEQTILSMGGWFKDLKTVETYNSTTNTFTLRIPLTFLFSVFHDHTAAIMGKHVLRFVRYRTDSNCYTSSGASRATIQITDMNLITKVVEPSDEMKLELLKKLERDAGMPIAFHQWETHEIPTLNQTAKDILNIKTSLSLERPRTVIVALQTGRRDNPKTSLTHFDHCELRNIRVWLNNTCYPLEAQNFDFVNKEYTESYLEYTNFLRSCYGGNVVEPYFNYNNFEKHPFFIIDCSKQPESTFQTTVDVKVELESRNHFPAHTRAYCIIIHDKLFVSYPLSKNVEEKH